MSLGDLVARLRDEGRIVSPSLINYAVVHRHIPDPPRDGAGNRVFAESHVEAMRLYLSRPRKAGRKPVVRKQKAGV
jgi:hypothetical protein